MHPRNPHTGRYDLQALSQRTHSLKAFIIRNPANQLTIDFSNPDAVMALNKALLALYYQIEFWQLPEGYLCPPIPGRADYMHYLADLIAKDAGKTAKRRPLQMLDIGCGANCIYPIIGSHSYGWQFVASDIDAVSVKAASLIVRSNAVLKNKISIVQQKDHQAIFHGIIAADDMFAATICNPPFHASLKEAQTGSQRKWKNLNKDKEKPMKATTKRNFGGQKAELWCPGGEISFLKRMANESADFAEQVVWFSSLVSKKDNVRPLKKRLEQLGVTQIEVVKMAQGQKISRFIAWSYLTEEQRQKRLT